MIAGVGKVFITRAFPFEALRRLQAEHDVDLWDDNAPPPREVLLERAASADALLTIITEKVDAELFDAAPSVKAVANLAVGTDNIDLEEAARRGIPVGNTPGALTETTADLAFALIMAAARRLAEGDRYVRAGKWKTWGPMLLMGPDVHGATIGIVGFGRIGQAVAKRAAGFGMTILYHDVNELPSDVTRPLGAAYVPMEQLLARADFISLHVNLTPETTHLIDAAALRSMKKSAVLVNTSRGPVVDGRALFEALRDGEIFAAALDVTEPEPLPADDPLLTLDNCLVVPHIASASRATRGKMAEMAAANLLAGLRGERLPTPVNPEVYDG
jgi:glyoxylate reductase